MFICPGQLACVLHFLLVRAPLLGIRGNSQLSDLVPERDMMLVKNKTNHVENMNVNLQSFKLAKLQNSFV